MSDFFTRLNQATDTERQALLSIPFIQHGVRGELSLRSYTAFLTQAYHHVKHTTPLLMACGARISPDKEWLRDAMAEYIDEEVGHQEWILNDIAACGLDKEAARNSQPSAATELMVANAAVKNLIRENSLQQLRSAIETGSKDGMHSMNSSLLRLESEGRITTDTAIASSNDIKGIMRELARPVKV